MTKLQFSQLSVDTSPSQSSKAKRRTPKWINDDLGSPLHRYLSHMHLEAWMEESSDEDEHDCHFFLYHKDRKHNNSPFKHNQDECKFISSIPSIPAASSGSPFLGPISTNTNSNQQGLHSPTSSAGGSFESDGTEMMYLD